MIFHFLTAIIIRYFAGKELADMYVRGTARQFNPDFKDEDLCP